MVEHDARPITAPVVRAWFRSSFKRGPWPRQCDYEKVAIKLERERQALAAKPTKPVPLILNQARRAATDLLRALPERHRFWKCTRLSPQIHRLTNGDAAATDAREVTNWAPRLVADAEQVLVSLESALKNAMPYLDFPPAAVTRRHRKSEHALIFFVAAVAAAALRNGGRTTISIEWEGPFVDFIVQALLGMGQVALPHATVASALCRTPATNWL